jgi:hypothetical protein
MIVGILQPLLTAAKRDCESRGDAVSMGRVPLDLPGVLLVIPSPLQYAADWFRSRRVIAAIRSLR